MTLFGANPMGLVPHQRARRRRCRWCGCAAALVLAGPGDGARGAGESPVGDYPQVRLCHGGVELIVCLPDAERGINRAVRFDRSGFVARASFKGHTWFGRWTDVEDPTRHDNVMGTACEFGMGTNGMPPPPGFDEAAEGEPFLKIGVGLLRKRGERYRFAEPYEILGNGEWEVRRDGAAIEFRQELSHPGGFGYRYRKRIALSDDPGFMIECQIENIGTRPIDQTCYAHNFVRIDDHPIGPDYRLVFPASLTPDRDLKGLAVMEGRVLAFRRPLLAGESLYTQFREHELPAQANGVLVENTQTGAGLRITGDRPLVRYHLWGTGQVICPEPFVGIRVAPGETLGWKDRYELLVGQ